MKEAKSKIYDCFLFYNEMDLLEIRLYELYDKVDKFVIVESTETLRGEPKPLYFQENKELFKKYQDKIVHVIGDRFETSNAWDREVFQRNQIMKGLVQCNDEDIILVSDVDEILRKDAIDKIITSLEKFLFVPCEQPFYRFYLNMRDYVQHDGTVAAKWKYLKTVTPNKLRYSRTAIIHDLHGNFYYSGIKNTGWHFSSMGGIEMVLQKFHAYSHKDHDVFTKDDFEHIKHVMCIDPEIVEIDSTFPKFVQENKDYFRKKGFIA